MHRKLILASGSPRRQQMMKDAGFEFEVRLLEVDEDFDEMPAAEVAEYLAKKKNLAYHESLTEGEVVLTADTVVVNDGEVLGKPVDEADAMVMIQSMAGKVHQVISAVCLSDGKEIVSFSDVVEVKMTSLSQEEIAYYVRKFKPMDKAGAYGIQEWIGMVGVEKISGSFYSVVGMPIHRVYQSLKNDFGINPKY